nr:hypothetical protein [uncultured Neokomagataea sp.]
MIHHRINCIRGDMKPYHLPPMSYVSTKYKKTGIFGLLIAAHIGIISANDTIPPKSQRAAEIQFTPPEITLPIALVKGYPFINGSISGVHGKLMLDTGSQLSLTINNHIIPTKNNIEIGTGFFGSGQHFSVSLTPEIRNIHIGPVTFPKATFVTSQDARQLENITPDFIGWVGYNAWAPYALKLDYRREKAVLYRGQPVTYLRGEHVIATLPFETRKLPNHPIMPATIGTTTVITAWDTGQYGTLYTSEAEKAHLLHSGQLKPSATDADSFDLSGLRIDGHNMPTITGISVETTRFAAATPIGLNEPNILTIGYGFLQHYKTVWDYRQHSLYLLTP